MAFVGGRCYLIRIREGVIAGVASLLCVGSSSSVQFWCVLLIYYCLHIDSMFLFSFGWTYYV